MNRLWKTYKNTSNLFRSLKISFQIWSLSFAPWWKVDDLDHDERSTVCTATVGGIKCWSWNWIKYHVTCCCWRDILSQFCKNMAFFCFAHLQSYSQVDLRIFRLFFQLGSTIFFPEISDSHVEKLQQFKTVLCLCSMVSTSFSSICRVDPFKIQILQDTLALGSHEWSHRGMEDIHNFRRWKGFIQFFMAPLIVNSPTI